jgi:type VI secretion system secreted protein VgrG
MASLSQTVAALAQVRQNSRILRLSFPNNDGPNAILLANRLEGDESLSNDFTFVVEVLADDAAIPLSQVQGKMVTVELVRVDGTLRYFNGYVFEFSLVKADGGIAFYSMVLKPWLAYLELRHDNYVFHGMALYDQTKSIFDDYPGYANWDYRVKAEGNDSPMTMATQFAETDHNYLHRRWEAAGWHYWYEHTASGHQLILSDDSTQAAPIDGAGPEVRFQRHGGSLTEDAIGEWTVIRQIGASTYALSAFDFKHPVPNNIDAPTLYPQGDVLAVESYEYAGAYGFCGTDGAAEALLRMEEIEARTKCVEAKGNSRFSMPRRSFRLTDHFSSAASDNGANKNEYLIVSVHHSISNNYLQGADTPADYGNRMSCIRKSIPWRPGRGYNSNATKILAPQTATVVALDGENMLTDEYGRIRVQFHWDRVGANNEKSSALVRYVSAWAGAELGMNATPRQGMEVLVVWLDGNPDHPLATGCVPNARNMPPWKLADQQALTGLRGRELTPDGGNAASGRSNHLVLDDTNGRIQAQIKSDHHHSQLSLGHITRIEDNIGRKDERGEGFALETGGAGALRSAKGLLLSTDGRARAVGGTLSRDELVTCLEKALDIAKGLGQAASDHQGGKRDSKPQQDLTEAVDALGHGAGNEAKAKGPAAGGQPVIALSGAGGITSATPKDQTHYAGQNIDTVAGNNQQHYAMGDILHTAAKNIEQFAVDGDVRHIANKGKIIVQAQNNTLELTADKTCTVTSVHDGIVVKSNKYIMLQVGDSFIRMTPDAITIDAKTLNLQSNAPSITAARGATTEMPKFDVGNAERKFKAHFKGDKTAFAADHHYEMTMQDGQVINGIADANGLTSLAQKDAIHIANLRIWKEPK